MPPSLPYKEIWVEDWEFYAPAGERPEPLCYVAKEILSGRTEAAWVHDTRCDCPFDSGPDVLFVAFFASAEFGCRLAKRWPIPERILDLYVEFRRLTCGTSVPCGYGLVGALTYFGLPSIAADEKVSFRNLAMRGGPYCPAERSALLRYCEADVCATAELLRAMIAEIDLPRALVRGRFMAAVARMERQGIPIDLPALKDLREGWESIKATLIAEVNDRYGVFVPVRQKEINPNTPTGDAILREAKEWEIDPYELADAVDYVHAEERAAIQDSNEARRTARLRSGLTPGRIARWEDAGLDHAAFPGLDGVARELAHELPALGIGLGYCQETGEDRSDYAAELWIRMREGEIAVKAKTHPEILRRAAEMVMGQSPDLAKTVRGPMRFSANKFAEYLSRVGIPWPRLESGELALDDETFREMARVYPKDIGPIRELRYALSQLRLHDLAVGKDGRNRCLLSPFGGRTSRNQPSTSKFIFGPATWIRSLIRPAPGRFVAYCDWSQQELAIAAYLSGDGPMKAAYQSGDFYLEFGKRARVIPPEGTKKSHAKEREEFKVVSLGVLYGLSADGIARKLNVSPTRGRELLQMHREAFPRFWRWSDAVQDYALLKGRLWTVFGWQVQTGSDANPRSMRNFPMQANAAEMMRLACCLATERGIEVNCPVHDALLVEGDEDMVERIIANTQEAMREASELVLPGFPLRSEVKVVCWPDRYSDPRGAEMWSTVQRLLRDRPTQVTIEDVWAEKAPALEKV